MKHVAQTVRAGEIDIEYHIADFTDPWSTKEPATLLMHHGYCRNMDFWRPWVPELSRHFRVLRFNSRGCGATSPGRPGEPYHVQALVDDVIGLLDALEIERVHWIGESSGGLVGLNAALSHPQRLVSLTVVNTPLKVSAAAAQMYGAGEGDHATAIRKLGMAEFARRTLTTRLDTDNASQEIQDWYVREMAKVPEHVAIRHLDLTFDADLLEKIRLLRLPVLNLVGDRSKVAEKAQMQQMQAILPTMRLVFFEGLGHGVNILRPTECVEEVKHFLDSLR